MNRILEVDVTLLTFLVGSLVPLLTALLTKWHASSSIKAVVNLVLSLAGGIAAYLIQHDGKSSVVALATYAITAYLASGVTYEHAWKPIGVAPAIQRKTANTGLGGHRTEPAT